MTVFEPPRPLTKTDSLADFHSGVDLVDAWAREHASRAQKTGTAVVYIVKSGEKIAGFYSLSAHSVQRDDVAGGWLKRNAPEQIPAILLGMLGVDASFQRLGLGKSLLKDAVERSLAASAQIGARALLVDPVNRGVAEFHKRYGFRELAETTRLALSLA